MRDATLKTINCASCGAGLDIFGGGRVRAHVCGYCGTTLDANDNYKALKKFSDAARPNTPFALGMKGRLLGVEFTIIGTLGVEEKWGPDRWTWVDHQVYSPTHGYAWLTLEDTGHLTFTRKLRSAPSPAFMTQRTVNNLEIRPSASFGGRNYTYYDSGNRSITFAEGEFHWTPKKGERSSTVSLAGGEKMLTYVEGPSEREVELTEYLEPAAVYRSFGARKSRTRGVHILQEYAPTPGEGLRSAVAGGLALICFGVGAFMNAAESRVATRVEASFSSFPVEIPFQVGNPDLLVSVSLWSDVYNSWAEFDIEVEDPEDEVLFETARGVEFYQGYDGGTWTEGSRSTDLTFRPTIAGEYTLTLSGPLSEVDWKGGTPASKVRLSISENIYATFWTGIAGVLLVLLAVIPVIRRLLHHKLRWWGSDWSDDE